MLDFTVAKPDNAFASIGNRVVMGDHDDGEAFFVQFIQEGEDITAGFGIEIAGWFVSQKQGWVGDQCSSDCHPLLLAAGKFAWSVAKPIAKPDSLEHVDRSLLPLDSGDGLVEQRHFDIFRDGQGADQVEGLEDESDAASSDRAEGFI